MASFYSIVRFVPDPIANESVNIGVVVFSGDGMKARFIKDWRKAKLLGAGQVPFLRDFAAEFAQAQLDLFRQGNQWNEPALRDYLRRWKNVIQFTEAKASIKPMDALLTEAVDVYLHGGAVTKRRSYRSHKAATAALVRSASASIENRFGATGLGLLKKHHALQGQIEPHDFDLVVGNGNPYLGAMALSFQVADTSNLKREVDALAFAVEDVRKSDKQLPVAIAALPPKSSTKNYQRAKTIFTTLGAEFVPEADLPRWMDKVVLSIPSDAVQHAAR